MSTGYSGTNSDGYQGAAIVRNQIANDCVQPYVKPWQKMVMKVKNLRGVPNEIFEGSLEIVQRLNLGIGKSEEESFNQRQMFGRQYWKQKEGKGYGLYIF